MDKKFKITVYSKENCCLCDKAKAIIDRVKRYWELEVEEVDITMDPQLFELYKEKIPVVAIDGEPIFFGKISELWLKRELARRGE
ncbi:Glutaredoxin [Carboxydocella sporoproducens DSM 16521]|uniref:Glutaredoxin n=2 Tax=Carboxydocella TaxID=178898 RepID=A0A1T4QZ29_9FIRM|nr:MULTISPECIES: glutaredoxin family protein [Carboxydocella]AVX19785.1 Glutaredoxin [Carboxydocella thermautotrophica]GAW28591.1 Glutaredoxin [Carboxydocella sp. ULO1]SKA08983.1 Glutaredoxin [Carboxydocella sporoproducens DSM 16521]